jgi:hypothetical protein
MSELNKEQRKFLHEAFDAIVALSEAVEKDNFSPCGVFHIEPFHTHWDKKTVREVKYQMKLYVDTWITYRMEQAFGLDRKETIKRMKESHRQRQITKHKWEIEQLEKNTHK